MDIEKILINNHIINQIENDQKNSLIKHLLDSKENYKQEMTDMLSDILKKLLDSRISNLEKNSNNHFSVIKQTSTTVKYITDISMKISKEIKEKEKEKEKKPQQNKRTQASKSSKKMNTYQANIKSTNRSVTVNKNNNVRGTLKNNSVLKKIKNDMKCKSPIRAKRNATTEQNQFKSPSSFRDRHKNLNNKDHISVNISPLKKGGSNRKNISTNRIRDKKDNLKINPINENFSRQSVISSGTNYTFRSSESSSLFSSKKNNNIKILKNKKKGINSPEKSHRKGSIKKNMGIIGRMKKNLDKNFEGNTPSKMKIVKKYNDKFENNIKDPIIKELEDINNPNNIIKIINKDILLENSNFSRINSNPHPSYEQSLNINKENIINLETNLKEEEKKFINEDPLLISSLKDLDFNSNNLLLQKLSSEDIIMNSLKNNEKKYPLRSRLSFQIENTFSDENLKNILKFLSIKDIINLKNCSRVFHRTIIDYLIKKCDIERNYFIEKQNELNIPIEEIPKKLSINDLVLTKGALKAINLLNEEILNRLFIEDKPPNNEILFVYKIYFQLIKHEEIIKNAFDDNIFWEKCKKYFREFGGKTGDVLNKVFTEKKLCIDSDNIYRIYKLTENKIDKIYPAYFSKICGTTGLFVFYIKDILDFLGFSNDKQIRKNAYWSFSQIINLIDSKINILNKYIN